jgi:predicted short-subunit dehydrogenase-like oxidoreductase (DUF2520 family)
MHIAAVFACNFTNHLLGLSAEWCKLNQLDFELLKPLINETFSRIENQHPFTLQTGPAKRFDATVIANHLNELKDLPNFKTVYENLTNNIQQFHTKPN